MVFIKDKVVSEVVYLEKSYFFFFFKHRMEIGKNFNMIGTALDRREWLSQE